MTKRWIFFIIVFFLSGSTTHAWEVRRETIKTSDGVTLIARRYYNLGGVPVILQHGFAVNLNSWDYPQKSFARYLADKGYDVWITNLRGHGEGEYQSGPDRGPGNWDIDTFVAYDVPAIIHTVTKRTGEKPFWIGHSMGGTIMYIYLEGVYGVPVTINGKKYLKMFISKKLSEERNKELKGLIAIASPAGLSFPLNLKRKGLKSLLKYNYYDYDLLLQMAADYPWEKIEKSSYILTHNETLLDKLHLTPPVWANNFTALLLLDLLTPAIFKYLGEKFPAHLDAFTSFIKRKMGIDPLNFVLNMIWNTKNTSLKGIYYIIEKGLDNFSPRVLQQWHRWLRNGTFMEQCDYSGCKPVDYLKNLNRINLPVLLISGEADKLVNRNNVYNRVYRAISSKDKIYKCFKGYGHVDLLMGNHAEEVFEYVYRWLRTHQSLIGSAR